MHGPYLRKYKQWNKGSQKPPSVDSLPKRRRCRHARTSARAFDLVKRHKTLSRNDVARNDTRRRCGEASVVAKRGARKQEDATCRKKTKLKHTKTVKRGKGTPSRAESRVKEKSRINNPGVQTRNETVSVSKKKIKVARFTEARGRSTTRLLNTGISTSQLFF